jgi:nucleoside-diphosphate-sugar epimerase
MTAPSLLVVGGTGFIGQHVVKRGICNGWRVTCVSMNAPGAAQRVPETKYMVADLTQTTSLRQLGDNRFDYVVNLGGYINHALFGSGGRGVIDAHFCGLLNLLEFLDRATIKRFVQIGSSDEYGRVPAPQQETMRECPISPYSLAKLAATQFLQMLHRTEGFPAVTLRLFLTYGPGQDASRFIPQIIKGCLLDLEFPTSRGEQLRDFCYVEDTVAAIFLALGSRRADGEVFNVGSGEPMSIRAVIDQVRALIGAGRPNWGQIDYREGENMELFADTKNIQTKLGWRVETGLTEGLKRTIDAMRVDI